MKKLILFMMLTLTACGSASHENVPQQQNQNQNEGIPERVTFAEVKDAFQRNRCLTCHSTKNHAAGIDLEQFTTAAGVGPSIRFTVDNGSMPLGGPRVGARDAAIIGAWVVSGTLP